MQEVKRENSKKVLKKIATLCSDLNILINVQAVLL